MNFRFKLTSKKHMTFECKSPVFRIQKSSLNISKHLCFSNNKCLPTHRLMGNYPLIG